MNRHVEHHGQGLVTRFNTASDGAAFVQTSSIGLSKAQDALINAAADSTTGGETGFHGRADQTGFHDQIRKLKRDIKNCKDRALRDIARLSLQQTRERADDFVGFLEDEANKWREKQANILDEMNEYAEAIDGAKQALDEGDLERGENGCYKNEDLQEVVEAELEYQGKDVKVVDGMSDTEIKKCAEDGIAHEQEIKQHQNDQYKMAGEVAEMFDENKKYLIKKIEDAVNDKTLTDAKRKEILEEALKECSKGILKELTTKDRDRQDLQETVENVLKDQTINVAPSTGGFKLG